MKRMLMSLPKQKEEKKKKKKKKKRKRKEKEKKKKEIRKLQCFTLKPEHGPRGIQRKSLKPGALSQLVGSHRLSARYMGEWVRLSEL